MTYNSRLFNVGRLRLIVEATDDIAEACGEVADALADYENAEVLTGDEKIMAREEARQAAWEQINVVLSEAERLRRLRDSLYDDGAKS